MTPHSSPPLPGPSGQSSTHISADVENNYYDGVDLHELYSRFVRGVPQILGLAALCVAITAIIFLAASPMTPATTSMRVNFSFTGYGRGEYPDHSKFDPDDIRASDVVFEALKRQGFDGNGDFQSEVRAALTIEGVIPPNVIRERDRLRAAGQTFSPYIPDEYFVTLTLPRGFPLSGRQRELLLNEITNVYKEKFQRTYAEPPLAFGNAFETLRKADYYEYELVLTDEIRNITAFLEQQLNDDNDGKSVGALDSDQQQISGNFNSARTFRSRTTNLSFRDLLEQTHLFAEIQLNETLGLIYQNGLSSNRIADMEKMDYNLHMLMDQEQKEVDEAKVVEDLLSKAQERSQGYVLEMKSQAEQQRPGSLVLDQGLIDSLLSNDSYNFLVRRALDAELKVKGTQAEKSRLLERRKIMETFLKSTGEDQSAVIVQVQQSLAHLETSYNELISNIRRTHADFAQQQFADAIHISMQPASSSIYRPLFLAATVGGVIGMTLGIGLSLVGIYLGSPKGVV